LYMYIYIYRVISEELNKDWLNLIFFLFFFKLIMLDKRYQLYHSDKK
jgi:hypothetical protein